MCILTILKAMDEVDDPKRKKSVFEKDDPDDRYYTIDDIDDPNDYDFGQ